MHNPEQQSPATRLERFMVHLRGAMRALLKHEEETEAAPVEAERRILDIFREVSELTSTLINVAPENLDMKIQALLERIGKLLEIDRAYVFRTTEDGEFIDNTHEWVQGGIEPVIEFNRNVPLAKLMFLGPRLKRLETVTINDLAELDEGTEQRFLKSQGIRSLLSVPMSDERGKLCGLIGFDSVHAEKTWTQEEILALQTLSSAISRAFSTVSQKNLLDEQRALFQGTLENLPVGYFEITRNGIITASNPALNLILGRDETVGVRIVELVDDGARRKLLAAFRMQNPDTPSWAEAMDLLVVRPDGSARVINASVAPTDIGFKGIVMDVTEKRVREWINEEIEKAGNLEEILVRVYARLNPIFRTRNFFVAVYDLVKQCYNIPFAADDTDDVKELAEGQRLKGSVTDAVRVLGKPILLDEEMQQLLEGMDLLEGVHGSESQALIAAPLIVAGSGEGIGTVVVQDYENPKKFTPFHVGLLEIAAGQISRLVQQKHAEAKLEADKNALMRSALENAELAMRLQSNQDRLHHLATHDPLTDLLNRPELEACLERELHVEMRHHGGLFLIMLDLDHFKVVNDSYGHPAGDSVLREIAEIIRKTIRSEDVAVRWGGEEFVILCRGLNATGAERLAERVRNNIERREIRVGDASIRMTASIGIAQFRDEVDGSALLKRADEAMYEAKNKGRNQVIVAQ